MKRMFAVLLAVLMLVSLFSMTALASGEDVTSPEKGNTDVDVQPSSPQTGGLNIGVIIAAAVLLCIVAVVTLKKAFA